MTCVAAFVEKGVAYIGADSARGGTHFIHTRAGKLFTNAGIVFGMAGCIRTEQILHYIFEPPPLPIIVNETALDRYLAADFVPAMREVLKNQGAMLGNNPESTETMAAEFLVAIRGQLFEVSNDFQAVRVHDHHHAVGSGMPYALGALHATQDFGLTPEARMRLVLQAAAHNGRGVRAPFSMATSSATGTCAIIAL